MGDLRPPGGRDRGRRRSMCCALETASAGLARGSRPAVLAAALALLFALSAVPALAQCSCSRQGPNLIQGGDFEGAPPAFRSDAAPGSNPAADHYWIVGDAFGPWRSTGHTGNFVLFDSPAGNGPDGLALALDVGPVHAGTTYCFSLTAANVGRSGRPTLRMSVGGTPLGAPLVVSWAVGSWQGWQGSWTAPAGVSSPVEIRIESLGVQASGHDFGLDNLSFTPCCPEAPEPDPAFDVELPACPGGPVTVRSRQGDTALAEQWWATPLGPDGQAQPPGELVCSDPACSFTLAPGRCYEIKHGLFDACQPWVEERQVVCLPKSVGISEDCNPDELCDRLACKPGEVRLDDECGCRCVENPAGCPPDLAEAGPDKILCPGTRKNDVQLEGQAPEGCTASWSPATGLTDPSALETNVWWPDDHQQPTTYELSVRCPDGCVGSDSMTARPGAEAGTLKLKPGRFPFLLCGQTATLELVGYSSEEFHWECASSPTGPWNPCAGPDFGHTAVTFTTSPLDGPLYVRVQTDCDDWTDVSNVVSLKPYCFGNPGGPGTTGRPPIGPAEPISGGLGGVVLPMPPVEGAQPPPGLASELAPPSEAEAPTEPPSAGGGEAPSITACPALGTAGEPFCACGSFPGEKAMAGLTLDGAPASLAEGNPGRVSVRLPADLSLGKHVLAGSPAAGFGPEDRCELEVVEIQASLDQDKLFRGQGTDLELRVTGTREPVKIRLQNHTPQGISVEGGDDQVVETSGGRRNRVTRRVRGLERGQFEINWTLLGTECPCGDG